MSLEGSILSMASTPLEGVWLVVRVWAIVFASLYFIFSLVVLRQVNLMTETVITEFGPYLRALSIIHAGISLGIIILFVGFLFG